MLLILKITPQFTDWKIYAQINIIIPETLCGSAYINEHVISIIKNSNSVCYVLYNTKLYGRHFNFQLLTTVTRTKIYGTYIMKVKNLK